MPHGFTAVAVHGGSLTLRLPVIWAHVRGALVATASNTPTLANLDELKELVEMALVDSAGRPTGQLVR